VLTHWKEREHVYVVRRNRIAEANGGVVPAYATAAHGVTVEPKGPQRPARRITAPVDTTADARPEDLVLKDNKRDKPKRSRNKRHGRPR
jgi:SecD/SecF fusion protein